MSTAAFISYAQNGEDVVLHRALGTIAEGRYVDVGANDPVADSVTYAFYQRGWSGITIDPVHDYAEKQRATRPRDTLIEAAVSGDPSGTVTLHQIADTGLSTLMDDVGEDHRAAGWAVEEVTVPARRLDDILSDAGWQDADIHFMVIDTEGSERDVLGTVDLRKWRPWVLVVEATRPQTTEPTHEAWESLVLSAGYRFSLFDGLSRFYIAEEKLDQLAPLLSAPANILDGYRTYQGELREQEIGRLHQTIADLAAARDGLAADRDRLSHERDRAIEEARQRDQQNLAALIQWRSVAIRAWAQGTATQDGETLRQQMALHINHIKFVDEQLNVARAELTAIRHTTSWRVTTPLRWVRRLTSRTNP